jgi:hypothetical protein
MTPLRDDQIREVVQIFIDKEQTRRDFIDQYGHIRPPQLQTMGGKAWILVGGEIYRQMQDGPYGFMNAIHDHALHIFGDSYLIEQDVKPFNERHPAIQWMHAYVEHREKRIQEGILETEVEQTGAGAAWFRFAYDLYTIRDNARLGAQLRERLLVDGNFQAARHELRVAAMGVTAGFNIQFEDESDNTSSHPEFVATDLQTGFKIAVEAKSRHRRGVLGFQRGLENPPGFKVNIRDIVIESYEKKTALPLYVFVDVNLPPAADDRLMEWLAEIHDTMSDLQAEGYADSCPANVTFFCNDPSHYLINEPISDAAAWLWIAHYEAVEPRAPHPAKNMAERFKRAYEQRVAPPANIPNF